MDGKLLATLAKDHCLRVFDPRRSHGAVAEGDGPVGSRGARIVWLDGNMFLVSGFNKYSMFCCCTSISYHHGVFQNKCAYSWNLFCGWKQGGSQV